MCISNAIKNGKKECPVCQQKLVSRRSLRKDSNFDALIAKIYPDRKQKAIEKQHISEESEFEIVSVLEVSVILRPHVNSEISFSKTQTRYLKLPQITSVDHLIKYLSLRYELEEQLGQYDLSITGFSTQFEIFEFDQNEFKMLNSKLLLKDLIGPTQFYPLDLYYKGCIKKK